jgi:3'-5' exoribonuclease
VARKKVSELKEGDTLDQLFLLQSRTLRTARNNSLYLQLELRDRTGSVPGRLWDATQEQAESIQPDQFVHVKGQVETYRDRLQVIVRHIELRPAAEADLAEFLPATTRDVDEMFDRIIAIAKTVKHRGLRKLLAAFLKNDETGDAFRRAPAAVSYHHAFLGGLLEHTLGVTEMAVVVAEKHPELDRELLLAGVILHDIGKIKEFSYERAFNYTDTGELLGHLYIGARMIEEQAAEIDELSPQTTEALVHLVLSHHGAYEYQSPKLPMTAEALAVHHLDNLDAKLNAFSSAILKDQDAESRWTAWNRMFERKLFKGHESE